MGYLSTSSFRYPIVFLLIICMYLTNVYASGMIFNMTMKPKAVSKFGRKAEEIHGPAPMDFHLGGVWTYFTELSIGTPPQLFTVQIDTGSDITWLNCQNCKGCAIDDDENGVHLKPYNPEASTTSEMVKKGCRSQPDPNGPCRYNISYFDGTVIAGHYVRDVLNYNKVTGDHQTQTGTTKFIFGCTTEETSNTSAGLVAQGINGLLGLGMASTTLLSQMSKSGSARNVFSMCIDRKKGGGIFAVGKLVNPKVEMLPNADTSGLYGLAIQSASFGDDAIKLNGTPTAVFDTGSDVAFVPEAFQVAVANLIWKKLLVIPIPLSGYHCFSFPLKELTEAYFDTVLPTLTFKFSDTVSISISPRNYMMYDSGDDRWCIASNKHEHDDLFILGVPFLSEKLIAFDNEKKTVGLTDYDCASSVEVEDGTGKVFDVDSHAAEPHV